MLGYIKTDPDRVQHTIDEIKVEGANSVIGRIGDREALRMNESAVSAGRAGYVWSRLLHGGETEGEKHVIRAEVIRERIVETLKFAKRAQELFHFRGDSRLSVILDRANGLLIYGERRAAKFELGKRGIRLDLIVNARADDWESEIDAIERSLKRIVGVKTPEETVNGWNLIPEYRFLDDDWPGIDTDSLFS